MNPQATFQLYGLKRRISVTCQGNSKFSLLLGQNGTGKTLLLKHISSGKSFYAREIKLDSALPSVLGEISNYPPNRVTYIYQDANEQFLGFSAQDELRLLEENCLLSNDHKSLMLSQDISGMSFEELSDGNRHYVNIVTGLRRISEAVIVDELDDYIDLSKVNSITSFLATAPAVRHVVISTHRERIYEHLQPTIVKLERMENDRHLESLLSLFKRVQQAVQARKKFACVIEMKNVNFGYWDQKVILSYNRAFQGPGLHEIPGRNGSGKSTLLRILSRQYRPRKGKVVYHPKKIRIFHLPQRSDAFFLSQTLSREARLHGINDMSEIPLDEFSKGQLKIIAVLLTLAVDAHAYLLDEPFEGLSDAWQWKLTDLLQELSSKRLLILTRLDNRSTAR